MGDACVAPTGPNGALSPYPILSILFIHVPNSQFLIPNS